MLRALATALLCVALAACTAGSMFAGVSDPGATTPAADRIGTGATVVGLLAGDEADTLSGGLPNSVYLAAKMATTTLSGSPVTLVTRPYDGSDASLENGAEALLKAGADIIIGPTEAEGATRLAALVADSGVPVVALAGEPDAAQRTYAAGFSAAAEAAVAAAEMKRRGYGMVVIGVGDSAEARHYAAALAAAAAAAGIETRTAALGAAADGATPISGLAGDAGRTPDAVALATGPSRAAAAVGALRADPVLAAVPAIGNSGWSMAPELHPRLGPGWYTAPADSTLSAFARRFTDIHGHRPTLLGAATYDLVVMAGALPQLVPDNPFGAAVLGNAQGFTGVSGAFRFGADGAVRRGYAVVPLK